MESLLDSMTITLSRPFIIKGESRDTITIREPKLRDRIMFSNDKSGLEERTATMLARLANLEREDLYALPACDYDQMEAAFNELVKPPKDDIRYSYSDSVYCEKTCHPARYANGPAVPGF